MKSNRYVYTLTLGYLILLLAGCGAGGTTPETKNTQDESAHCINCHEDASGKITPGTGINVVTEWKRSTHMTANGASCSDCHDDGYLHTTSPESCSKCHTVSGQPKNPTNNPDQDAKCSKCHNRSDGFRISNSEGITINTGIAHFTNLTTGTIRRVSRGLYYINYTSSYKITSAAGGTAVWAASDYNPVKGDATKYGCRACHNPHDTTSKIVFNRNWSRSGHGDPNSGSRTSRYFKIYGSTLEASVTMGDTCVRCHTSTGFINYVKSDFKTVTALASAGTPDHTKEVTGCNVCHDDGKGYAYSFKLRDVLAANLGRSGVPAYYNFSAVRGGNARANPSTNVSVSLTFPDASSSNICIVCHMGREVGLIIKKAYLQGLVFSPTPRISAHDFAAGANLYQESGFEFYTSAAKYPKTAFLHNKAGISNINGTGSKGPCITCHLSRPVANSGSTSPDSHTFMPTTKGLNNSVASIVSNACNKCHPVAASGKSMDAATLEKNRLGFKAAMTFLRNLIRSNIVGVTGPNSTTGALTYGNRTTGINWTLTTAACPAPLVTVPGSGNLVTGGADAIGPKAYTMGAAFNYELLYADFGSYVHNPNYIKRLIFDSIDWIQDCQMNVDNGATVCSSILDPLAKAYLCPLGVRL